jgi:hypothetical protein
MFYIQLRSAYLLETVNEFETRKEARAMLKKYQLSNWAGFYYISTRACKNWK